jgi:hypothetical protein
MLLTLKKEENREPKEMGANERMGSKPKMLKELSLLCMFPDTAEVAVSNC